MSRIVGIDLGTTNSLVAVVDSGIPLVIADEQGRRLTPSAAYWPGPGQEPVAGHPARRARLVHPAQTVYSIKRFMGRRGAEVSPEDLKLGYTLRAQGNQPVQVTILGENYSPEQISSIILAKLKRDAEAHLGEPVERAVITVPAYFNDAQRQATKTAGELAGLVVERIVNEPTAAALAYGLNLTKERARIAVYDLGGGTFDLSILELREGVFQVLATHGNTRLGGDDIDQRLMDYLVSQIREESLAGSSLEATAMSRLREAAELAKITLSSELETEVLLPFLTPNFSFRQGLTRQKLEALAMNIVERTREPCVRALADAGIAPAELDQVILVGGQTRMPLVRRLVGQWFQCADFEEERGEIRLGTEYHRPKGPRLNTSQNPDEAVALGAAIQAEILSGGLQNVLLLDVTPLSLGIETFGGLMNVIIPRNSTIPLKAGEMFTTAMDNQRAMLIQVLQGERERAKDNWRLGQFTLEFEPAPRGQARVGVQFEIDANGILHVLARDTSTGREKTAEIRSVVDVDDEAVQRMVEESVEHAFEDLKARQWVEIVLRARRTIEATRKSLAEAGPEFELSQRRPIEEALATVEQILPRKDETGDPAQLKQALTLLDAATGPLAEMLMDRAMESVLRRRGLIQ